MAMEFTGKVIFKGSKETVGQNGFEKLTIVLEEVTDKEYKASLMVEFFKDKIELTNALGLGDTIKVYVNPRAKEYNGRRYNSIACRKLDVIAGGKGGNSSAASYNDNDDLPF